MIACLCDACTEVVRGICYEFTDLRGPAGVHTVRHYCGRCVPLDGVSVTTIEPGNELRIRVTVRP